MPGPSPGLASRVARAPWAGAVAVGLAAVVVLGWDLASEPWFIDESAYYSQSYFFTLFASGRVDDPAWLDYPGCDLPPLTKYLIGGALRGAGYRTPGPADARRWYDHTDSRFDPPGALTVARVPIVLVGAIGCLAVYGIGTLAGGRAVGLVAAGFLMANPLYRLHARRAMSDVPYEAFLLLGLWFGLSAWSRQLSGRPWRAAGLAVLAGVCAGLSVLAKFSGLLALIVMAAWVVLASALKVSAARKIGVALVMAIAAAVAPVVFVAFNPFLTAQPSVPMPAAAESVKRMGLLGRAGTMVALRYRVSAEQKVTISHNALYTPAEKLAVAVVQGFGRFGPFGPAHSDSVKRFELRQDWGALVWLPWVAAGAFWAVQRGRAQARAGEPPTAWAVLVYFATAFAVVTLYLPMAWDRYLLPIEAPAALLAAGAAVAAAGRLARRKE